MTRAARLALLAVASFMALGGGLRAASVSVDQVGLAFSEKSVAAPVGGSIVFANHDDVTHNIRVIDANEDTVDVGLQKPGQNLSFQFDKAGRFLVRCSIHPGMRMVVNVK